MKWHLDRNGGLSTMTYTATGKLDELSYPVTSVNFNYDERVNLKEMVDASGTTTNTFDAINRLTEHTDPNDHSVGTRTMQRAT